MSNSRRLFRPAPFSEWRRNAVIGASLSNEVVYAVGFKEAGDGLVEACTQDRGSLDALFYPICYCYRHYVELELKRLIVMAEDLHELLEVCGAARGQLHTRVAGELHQTHSLERLLNLLVERFELVCDEPFSDSVKSTIIELHNFDPTSETFRYAYRRDGSASIPDYQHVDIANIRDRIEEVDGFFSGMDGWMDAQAGNARDFIADARP